MTKGIRNRPIDRYHAHKRNAKDRGIAFIFTFAEWIRIWIDSGHWAERGVGKGKYNMARFGDVGPYSVDNVRIIKHEENCREGNLGKNVSFETKNKLRQTRLGTFNGSREQSAKNAFKMGKGNLGRIATIETRARMSASRKRYLAQRGTSDFS